MARFSPCRTTVLFACVIGIAQAAYAQLPTAQLTAITPPGAKFGTSVDVTLSGADLDEAQQLIFSHEGITAEPKMTPGDDLQPARRVANQFTVKVAGDVPPGMYEARAVGRYGVSNPRAFVVGLYDQIADGGNTSREAATQTKVDQTVAGRLDNNAADYLKLALQQGQRLILDCQARRIDSRVDGVMEVLNAEGQQLARSDSRINSDPFIDFTAPQDGDYYVVLYDALYRGGGEYFYRLTAHVGPHLDFVFPAAGPAGSNQEYTLYGRNLPDGEPTEIRVGDVPLEKLTVNIPLPDGDGQSAQLALGKYVPPQASLLDSVHYRVNESNPVTVYFATAPVVAEVEAGNDPSKAQKVTVPCEVAGQFYPARDIDYVQFEAKQGQVLYLDLLCHRLGHASDPRLLLQKVTTNDQGEESVSDVANVDDPGDRNGRIGSDFDTSTDDPTYRFAVKEDGLYRVVLRDQFGGARNDPRVVYRFSIREAHPDYRLVAVTQAPNTPANANAVRMGSASVRKGGTTMISVRVQRRDGFDKEIHLSVEGLPEKVRCRGAILGAGQATVDLVLEAAEDAPDWAGFIRVVGKAQGDNGELVRYARGGAPVWGTGNRQQDPPAFRTTRDLAFAVVHEAAPTWVEAGPAEVLVTSRGGKLEIPVKVVRRRDFKGDLKLVCNGLPKELKPGDLTVKGDAGEAKLAINVTNKNAKPGVYQFFLRADTKSKFVRNPDAVPAAEAEQKRLVELVNQLNESVKQANAAKETADKAAAAADKAVQEAAEEQQEEAKKKAQEAAEAKAAAEKAAADAAAKLKRAQELKAAADKQLADVKKQNAPKDFNFLTVSTPVRLRIVESPLELNVTAPAALKPGGKVEVPVKLERLYGFADAVEVLCEIPKGATGLEVNKLSLAKDAAEGKFEVVAKEDAAVGDHTVTIRAKAKFNNIDVETVEQIVLKVAK